MASGSSSSSELIVVKARGFPQDNPPNEAECSNCGMPLPEHADSAPERRQRRFLWFCIGLSIFCAVMIVWLPRYLF
ncbi:MAG: DnrP protein [Gammaproteobacteria bacterium HGW-Gammaproteobacteria-9]|nr:MAG: DnrP protein [Gammaproteobacteria bacterium HGW-Gammaproteobacteria-9]